MIGAWGRKWRCARWIEEVAKAASAEDALSVGGKKIGRDWRAKVRKVAARAMELVRRRRGCKRGGCALGGRKDESARSKHTYGK